MAPEKPRRFMFRNVPLLLAVLGIVLALNLVRKQSKPEPVVPPIVEPSSAPYRESIGARGLVERIPAAA